MKQKEFAHRMGLSEKHISRLINGQVELTQDVALRPTSGTILRLFIGRR
jgi:HTH-type transcriptional regulator/antitoxin HigA